VDNPESPRPCKYIPTDYAQITLTSAANLSLDPQPTSVVQVALDTPLERLFDYRIPAGQTVTSADVGRRVRVPFGPHRKIGVLVALGDSGSVAQEKLKMLDEVDRALPPLPADIMNLARFAAGYYQHPFGQTLLALLPPALKRPRFRTPAPQACRLTEAGRLHWNGLPERAHAQRRLGQRLARGPVAMSALGDLRGPLREWLKRGFAEAVHLLPEPGPCVSRPELTRAQQVALEQVMGASEGFKAWLLHGVTGSGKTEVYLRLIEETLALGRQVLVLAPEIHLTPQLTERFRQRFPERHLVCQHSGLADGPRLAAWLDCAEGRADLVLGTRLSVFTPMPRLGLLIVDEEHDPAYKQMEGLRYHARDVAVWRARQAGIPILLGSATPALESWRNAQSGRYGLISLPDRAHAEATLPDIQRVDSRTDRPRQGLTGTLIQALAENLARGEQSLVFINRRGYAPTLYCQQCGHISDCPRCSAHQVLHRQGHGYELRCHHCGLAARPPQVCPACGNPDLRPFGQGTQKVEEALAQQFPSARLLRIDRDTASRRGAFDDMRRRITDREVDILIGTQIIAKGHDFPMLTLVGIVGADQALMSPDFRAGERLFAQLMQVAGRAGRAAHQGRVLIQTDYPNHPLYATLAAHDYPAFAARTLRERRDAEFPPFTHQALLRAESASLETALDFLGRARALGAPLAGPAILYDPVAASMARISNWERAQLLVQCRDRRALQAFLATWVPGLREITSRQVRWHLDVDPLEF